jgi:hypothetical protein
MMACSYRPAMAIRGATQAFLFFSFLWIAPAATKVKKGLNEPGNH